MSEPTRKAGPITEPGRQFDFYRADYFAATLHRGNNVIAAEQMLSFRFPCRVEPVYMGPIS